jgi:hypothetical protein
MERRFRVTVRGQLDGDFGRAFGDVQTSSGNEVSTLSGPLIDAAFLDGILGRLRDLGLELVGVETGELPEARRSTGSGEEHGGHRR